MKRIILFFTMLVLAIVAVGCDKEEYVFEVEAEDTVVQVGKTITIFVETDKSEPVFEWSSSDDEIATVNQVGMVRGVSVGEVTITVKLEGVGEKEVEIEVVEKDFSNEDAKNVLKSTLNEYLQAKGGSLKLSFDDGVKKETSETIFNYNADESLDSLMYKLKADSDIEVYIKDGFSYILANGTKTKRALTAQEEATIKDQYSHKVFLAQFSELFNEDKFFAALEFEKQEDNTVKFNLDLSKYDGEVLNTKDLDEFNFVITLVDDKVTKVEMLSKQGNATKDLVLEFRGTGVQTINYPEDLDTY